MLTKLNNIEVDQKFDFKTQNGNYSIFKVCKIDNSNLGYFYNIYETSSNDNLVEIDYKNNYDAYTIYSSLTELKQWVKDGKIIYMYK